MRLRRKPSSTALRRVLDASRVSAAAERDLARPRAGISKVVLSYAVSALSATLIDVTDQLHRELWTSWASLLRSYAAVHSLGRQQHAVVEVSDDSITVRYGLKWMQFTRTHFIDNVGVVHDFALTENGRARIDADEDEMDLCAEQLASAIISV